MVELLVHMLQTDPMRRANVGNIRQHEWFKRDLPPYLFPDNDISTLIPDEEAIQETCDKFGAEPGELRKILEEKDNNTDPLAIAYRLIMDNKRKAEGDGGAPIVDYQNFMVADTGDSASQQAAASSSGSAAAAATAAAAAASPPASLPPGAEQSPVKPHPERIARECHSLL